MKAIEGEVTTPSTKVDKIKAELDDFITLQQNQMKVQAGGYKKWSPTQENYGYRIKRKLSEILRRYRSMSVAQALKLTADDIYNFYCEYQQLISYFNEVITYVPDKIEFCAYACIPINSYNSLIKDGADDVQQILADIDADMVNATLAGAEGGVAKEKTSELRLRGKMYGHDYKAVGDIENALETIKDLTTTQEYWNNRLDDLDAIKPKLN